MKTLPMLDTVKVSLWSGAVLQEQKFLKAKESRQKKRIFYGQADFCLGSAPPQGTYFHPSFTLFFSFAIESYTYL